MHTIFLHLMNEEPFLAEIEELPSPTDTALRCLNPRRRDGKELHYVMPEVTVLYVPWHRISFVELMPSAREEEIISPFGG
jgi:hypothetical protein